MQKIHRSLALLLILVLPALAGCGAGGYVDDGYAGGGAYVPIGTVYAENDTFTLPSTVMYDFALWPSYAAPAGTNLLSSPLQPGEAQAVADVDEDYYDADALMSDGFVDYLETWADVFVVGDDATTFVAF